jgi:hypothetical protein
VPYSLYESDAFLTAADMMMKLTAPGRPWVNAYDAATVVAVEDWLPGQSTPVRVLTDQDIRARHRDFPIELEFDKFIDRLIQRLLERTPGSEHVQARRGRANALGLDAAAIRTAAALQKEAMGEAEDTN